MSQSPPTTLGKYQILREIARSNDIVYEAYDPVMNRRVALKELAMPGGASDQQKADRVKRFLREAKAAGSLAHPNIVTIYEVGEESGRRYIAMEYLDGHNLRNMLDTKGFIEPIRAIEIVMEVLKGLEFAHSHGVIHRDIKPDNIQLLENGEVKITDFGIARLTFEPNLTMDGQVFGTPSYMSPEQINGREIDARSDLFSVGVILYEMVAGQKPFTGDSVVSITYSIMNTDPPQPSQCGPGLWQVIRQGLDKSPQLRWSSAKDMYRSLESVSKQMASGNVIIDPYQNQTTSYQAPLAPPPVVAAPTHTPYGTPMPGQIAQAQGQPYGYLGQTPLSQPYGQQPQQPMAPIPLYYPPPPRSPLVSPETKSFLGKLFTTVVVFGTIFAIIAMLIIKGADAVNKSPNLNQSVKDASENKGKVTTQPDASNAKAEDDKNTPASVREVPSEEMVEQVIKDAMFERDPKTRLGLWSKASRYWSEIGANSLDQRVAKHAAVASFLNAADELYKAGDTERAKEAVYEAQGFAIGDRELEQSVYDWQQALQR